MGFPIGYTDLFIPPLFLQTLTILTHFHKLIFTFLSSLGFSDFLSQQHYSTLTNPILSLTQHHPPISAIITRDLLPLVKVSHIDQRENYCSVCLYEVNKCEEIRLLVNCKHVFHKECIDSWIDLDHRTCPLCRTPFLQDDLLREFNQRLLLSNNDFYQCNYHDGCSDLAMYVDYHYN